MFSENVENGDLIALACAVFITVAGFLYVVYFFYLQYAVENLLTFGDLVIYVTLAFIGAIFGYFIVYAMALSVFMPGNVIQPVAPADESIVTVNVMASRMTGFAIFSALLVKLCGKRPQTEQKKDETAAVASVAEE